MEIISRKDAKLKGLRHYYTGKPCKRGHVELRFVSTYHCTKCVNITSAEWAKNNPAKIQSKKQNWYYRDHKKTIEYNREYYKKNKERKNAQRRLRNLKNPERRAAHRRNGKAKRKAIEGTHTESDINKIFFQQGGLCNACGRKLIRYRKKQYHIDHIIPTVRGGTNWPNNIQLLCPDCNLSKNDKDPVKWARENGRLF